MDKAAAAQAFGPAAREALRAFPIEPDDVELVALSENVTFRVTTRNEAGAYVLRLHRPGYHTLEELQAERVWTRALAKAGIAVPIPVTTRDGSDYVRVAIDALGQQREAGVTRWVDGELLADVLQENDDVTMLERWFEQLGGLEARMHNQSSGWRPPPSFRRHAVDADGLMGEAPFWGPFWDHPILSPVERSLLLETRDRIRGAMDRYGRDPATFGMIHADLHAGNLLVADDRLTVIDFDDAGFGWHAYDIAVALFYHQSSPHFEAVQRMFVAGYRAERDLTDEVLALIPMFLLVRGLAHLGWLHQRPEIDASAFIEKRKNRICAQCVAFEPPC